MQTRTPPSRPPASSFGFVPASLFGFLFAFLAVASLPSAAYAHFNLIMPPPADNAADGGKGAPPCGPTTPSNVVTPATGGHPLTVSLDETVLHPGHYRFALSINSRAELPADPVAVVAANGNSVSAPIQNPPVFPVLADGVFVHTTGTTPIRFSTTVTLPNVTCAKCTLQVIEFMAQHGPNPGGGFYYHHCADLAITADPNLPPAGGTGGAPAGGSGGTTGGTGGMATVGTGGTTAGGSGGTTGAGSGGTTGGNGTDPGTTTSASGGCSLAGRSARLSGGTASVLLALGLALALRRRRR